MNPKTKVLIAQLGSPRSPAVGDVRRYLREFLGDPRVVDVPRLLWFFILNLLVLPFRPKKSAKAYARIYQNESFPLIDNTEKFCAKLQQKVGGSIEIDSAYLLGPKRVGDVFASWERENKRTRAQKLIVLPQFPQYSESTTASVVDTVNKVFAKAVNIPNFEFVNSFYNLKAFIDLSAKKINEMLKEQTVDQVVISFHGLPLRRITEKEDVYYQHCAETFELIKKQLEFDLARVHMTFQSRFGSEQWLTPATDTFCIDLIEKGNKNLLVYCPSFVADCLETTDEIGNELGDEISALGGKIIFVPCLNDDDLWVEGYANYIQTLVSGDRQKLQQLHYPVSEVEYKPVVTDDKKKSVSKPMDPKAKKTIKILFLTLFLDLVGFSIIFPMFPELAKHYLFYDSESYLLNLLFGWIANFAAVGGGSMNSIVLFGGALGALYAVLQFIFAPIWGSLSDRYGRKKILKITMYGMGISYLIWGFAGAFWMLLLGRFIGGMMGGNLSVATAAVADVTDHTNRSKGMAWVGIAFAMGFIFGPALGGLLSLIDLTEYFPESIKYGINPFSVPAFLAMILSFINFFLISLKFEETFDPSKVEATTKRSNNPLSLLRPLPYPGVNRVNYSYFLFISAFSGMEFTLTFLAVERLNFTSMDNAYMFIFIGVLIALVQGGYVRRSAAKVGEKKMATRGLLLILPGLVVIAYAYSVWMIYLGLFFLATGSAMAIPTLTAMSSLFAPSDDQGRVLGIFRSLGSLGRVVGPIVASLIYWRFGGQYPYLIGAAFMLIPIGMLVKVKVRGS